MTKFSISLLVAAISGCSSWPDHGHGGDAQWDASHNYYVAQVDYHMGHVHESKGDLETQWSIASLKLDSLVLRGGQECLPARVRQVSMMAKRSRRELDGNLLADARNSLIIYQRELDQLENRLNYIKRHTECGHSRLQVAQQATQHSIGLNEYQVAANRKLFLLNLLNDDYSFDFDSDILTQHYREKLEVAGHYLNQETSISLYINGHTDSDGDYKYNQDLALRRAKQVKQVLMKAGVAKDRLVIRSFGEQLPVETNQTALGKMINRRVSVEFVEYDQFYIPGSDGYLFQQGSQMFGFNEEVKPLKRIKYLKYWNKQDHNLETETVHSHEKEKRGVKHSHVLDYDSDDWDSDWDADWDGE